jgi:hypothetical protein
MEAAPACWPFWRGGTFDASKLHGSDGSKVRQRRPVCVLRTVYENAVINQRDFLRETLATTQKRLEGGDVTPTDWRRPKPG